MNSILENINKYWVVKNASPSEEDDGNMIAYWEEQTGRDLRFGKFECPKCHKKYYRNELDGAHIVKLFEGNHPQYITILCQHCNRQRDEKLFRVLKEDVITAP